MLQIIPQPSPVHPPTSTVIVDQRNIITNSNITLLYIMQSVFRGLCGTHLYTPPARSVCPSSPPPNHPHSLQLLHAPHLQQNRGQNMTSPQYGGSSLGGSIGGVGMLTFNMDSPLTIRKAQVNVHTCHSSTGHGLPGQLLELIPFH